MNLCRVIGAKADDEILRRKSALGYKKLQIPMNATYRLKPASER
ncbi:Unknown protein sequence [Pseudomonas syringae pv. cilantro]|uniref:Uncharacterized protein n=1 Tax=Pseudomonas syringae pv. cilantro TaxID=81035 RepID=A0A0N0GFP3_PSESX|nr:Unknown protein sequence [Pseudomonas syringae pv. cilantro]